MNIEKLLDLVKNALEDKKAQDIKILDVRRLSNFTDFMIVATGRTGRQVFALAQHVIVQVKNSGYKPLGEEGDKVGEWVLVDLGDIIVHVMQPHTRDFYQLEKLWSEIGENTPLESLTG
jgi:ribosome-associated protein